MKNRTKQIERTYTLRFHNIDGTYFSVHSPQPFTILEITKEEYENDLKNNENITICTIE